MVNGNLPDGWTTKNLGEIGQLLRGVSYRKEDATEQPKDGFVPILRATNIQDEKLILDNELVYVPSTYVKSDQYLTSGDIVVCMSSGSKHLVGKTAQLFHEWQGSFGTFCAAIRPSPATNAKFFGYFFSSPGYRDFIRKKAAGININNLKPSDFETLEIPVPPLPEQERIVAKIEELFTQLEAGTAALKRAQAGLKRYKASVLKAACEGTLLESGNSGDSAEKLLRSFGKSPLSSNDLPSLPDGWCWAQLGDLASHITSGSRGWAQYYSDDGAIFIRAQDINTDKLVLEEIAHVNPPRDSAEVARTRVFENDLLITITGANVTKTAKVNVSLDEAYMSQHVGLVRPITAELSDYLYYWIICPAYGRKVLEKLAYGAGKPGLNLTNIRELRVALPPLAEQRRIVAEVERRLSVVKEVETVVAASVARAGRLRQSVLKQAFVGKLSNTNQ